jgi:hypothetical protein
MRQMEQAGPFFQVSELRQKRLPAYTNCGKIRGRFSIDYGRIVIDPRGVIDYIARPSQQQNLLSTVEGEYAAGKHKYRARAAR